MIKKTMELVWHDCKTCPPEEKYNERLFISSGFQVVPVVWINGKFYHKSGPSEGKEVDINAPCVYWADIDYTTIKFFNRAGAPQKKWHYCVNTVSKNDNPVQLEGDIEAESEYGAIQKLIDTGVVCPRSYEFLELVEVSDWLIAGLSEEQLQKEREEALRESKNNSGTQ